MKKKIVSALMVAAMVVTAFAGCGSDKGGTSTPVSYTHLRAHET